MVDPSTSEQAELWRMLKALLRKHSRVMLVDREMTQDGASVYAGSHDMTCSDGESLEEALDLAVRRG